MEQLTRFVLRHRRLVVAFWLVVTIVGIATVSKAVNAMDRLMQENARNLAQSVELFKTDRRGGSRRAREDESIRVYSAA